MKYIIHATVNYVRGGYTITGQVPTFLLDDSIQGITDAKHAEFIAEEIINPTKNKNLKVSCTAFVI